MSTPAGTLSDPRPVVRLNRALWHPPFLLKTDIRPTDNTTTSAVNVRRILPQLGRRQLRRRNAATGSGRVTPGCTYIRCIQVLSAPVYRYVGTQVRGHRWASTEHATYSFQTGTARAPHTVNVCRQLVFSLSSAMYLAASSRHTYIGSSKDRPSYFNRTAFTDSVPLSVMF